MSHRPKKLKRKRFSINRSRQRFIALVVVVLAFGLIGAALEFFSSAAPSNGSSPPSPTPAFTITTNPPVINTGCALGINIALVADMSGSVATTSEFPELQTALTDFVSSLLPSTNSKLSLTEFGQSATILSPLTTKVQTLDNDISNLTNQGSTNWDAGLMDGYSTLSALPSTAPRLLIIATDGYPNYPGGDTTGLDDAVAEANTIKAAGVHILAVGLGTGIGLTNLEDITGMNVDSGATATVNTDVITGTSYTQLDGDLLNIAQGTCGGTGGFGTGGSGTGNGGTGNGTGNGGSGAGTGGGGSGLGTTGTSSGSSVGPTPQPSPNPAPKTTQSTEPNPAPAATQSTQPQPNPAPKPTAQGTQTQPPEPQPSPFYDGKQYTPGSAVDNLAATSSHHGISNWWYFSFVLLILLSTGSFLVWRNRRAANKASLDNNATRAKE